MKRSGDGDDVFDSLHYCQVKSVKLTERYLIEPSCLNLLDINCISLRFDWMLQR